MKVSTKGRYALRIMLAIAQYDNDEYVPVKEISQAQEITMKYMEQIISQLKRAGFLKSLRGNAGGYKLTKPAEKYSVGEILRAVEGSLAPITCLDDTPNQCKRSKKCLTLKFWTGLNDVISDYVNNVSLADLLPKK
ncbi:MAG: Rrf2 family transcriptional regulator [Endomicrobia bacterium]|nr:Rrf2 family transcriptional regulator [Endomicrobiia bacterium]